MEPTKPSSAAEAILNALDNSDLRRRAAEINRTIILERAEVGVVREKISGFYESILT